MKNIQLLQSYYRFLSLGKYLEFMIQSKNFSKEVLDIAIVTWERSHFWIKSSLIKTLLQQIHKNPDQKNIFWYLVEISSFRGIFGIMRELLENNTTFKQFTISRLYEQYFAFEQIIRLVRNVLSHTTTAEIYINKDDFVKQRDFLTHEKITSLEFQFLYSNYRKERTWKENYWIHIQIDFDQIKENIPLFSIISLHNLYLLGELCYNLCEIFKTQYSTKKTIKSIWKKKNKK